jgi:hypothetical protein
MDASCQSFYSSMFATRTGYSAPQTFWCRYRFDYVEKTDFSLSINNWIARTRQLLSANKRVATDLRLDGEANEPKANSVFSEDS